MTSQSTPAGPAHQVICGMWFESPWVRMTSKQKHKPMPCERSLYNLASNSLTQNRHPLNRKQGGSCFWQFSNPKGLTYGKQSYTWRFMSFALEKEEGHENHLEMKQTNAMKTFNAEFRKFAGPIKLQEEYLRQQWINHGWKSPFPIHCKQGC